MTASLLAWLLTGTAEGLPDLEKRITAEMATLRRCRTPAGRKAIEERLRPLLEQRRELTGRTGRAA